MAFDERYMRPAEVEFLVGDYSKTKEKLGWEPKTGFEDLVKLMVDADMKESGDQMSGVVRPESRD